MSLKERFQDVDARNWKQFEQDRAAYVARIPARWGCLKTLGAVLLVGILIPLIIIIAK